MDFVNTLVQGVMLGGLYALFAAGLSLMFGVMRMVNLAHGDLAVAAAYLVVVLLGSSFLPLWLVILIALPLFALIGYATQRGLFSRSLKAGPLSTLLVTFGLSIIVQNGLLQAFSADTRTIDFGALNTGAFRLGPISVSYLGLLTLALAVAVIAGVQLFPSRTRTGRMMRAVSDDADTASLVGANSRHLYAIATAIAFGTVALAGIMSGARSSFDPSMGPAQLIFAFEAVVIGGLGSLGGTLAGGAVLGLTQAFAAQIDPSSTLLAGHLVFLAVLAFRPQGLIPQRAV
ncbi:branched-chain amino acid ABC transporter permease [Pseudarthrobacter albicanus]|uniref:branched-chain amino acid ABC transporter permease n=1 Tax=Pseudarthrobacter albicanus TaxID=2823873 RepID=UPI001BA60DDF|nr:branched-chain amino acid ABC transporter permease [Pseudarthrobacter albicanus]